jgi:ASC-1-like (ASCH) protein
MTILMQHVAIMRKSWKLIPKILAGEKTIESRWYKNRICPWNRINVGDIVYFKDSGEKVTVYAKVRRVMQFDGINEKIFNKIVKKYGKRIGINGASFNEYYSSKNYCILVFLEDIVEVDTPFKIDKSGFGNACAWLCVDDIEKIKVAS